MGSSGLSPERLTALSEHLDRVRAAADDLVNGEQRMTERVWIPLLKHMASVPALADYSCENLHRMGLSHVGSCSGCEEVRRAARLSARRRAVARRAESGN